MKRWADQRCEHSQVTFHILCHNRHYSKELFPKLSHQFLPNDTGVVPEASCQRAAVAALPNDELKEEVGDALLRAYVQWKCGVRSSSKNGQGDKGVSHGRLFSDQPLLQGRSGTNVYNQAQDYYVTMHTSSCRGGGLPRSNSCHSTFHWVAASSSRIPFWPGPVPPRPQQSLWSRRPRGLWAVQCHSREERKTWLGCHLRCQSGGGSAGEYTHGTFNNLAMPEWSGNNSILLQHYHWCPLMLLDCYGITQMRLARTSSITVLNGKWACWAAACSCRSMATIRSANVSQELRFTRIPTSASVHDSNHNNNVVRPFKLL